MTMDDAPAENPPEDRAIEVPFQVTPSAGRILFRAMRKDPSGGPMVGPSARTLGARPNTDIPVVGGYVVPDSGGLSVTLDRPEILHPFRRPPSFGGTGKDPVWCIGEDQIGGILVFRVDTQTHGLIEPAFPMTLDAFSNELSNTRALWRRV